MVIMAIDHSRDFFHSQAFLDDPLNLQTTYPFLFFTRWITHFCAPIFVFLSGVSIYIQSTWKSKWELCQFLFTRGLWLVFIEVAIISFSFTFDLHERFLILQVIWAIGISMIILSLLIWLPYPAILGLGLVIVFGHDVVDFFEASHTGAFGFWWDLLHHGSFTGYPIFGNHVLLIIYPFVPWTGLMLIGYGIGKLYNTSVEAAKRKKALLWMGSSVIVFFALLRFINLYGDPSQWSTQNSAFFTFLSFINTSKYPPSLLYLCMTIGPGLLFLAWVEPIDNWLTKIFVVFGRVPFFFYVLHFFLLHGTRAICYVLQGHSLQEGIEGSDKIPFHFVTPGEDFDLWVAYVAWIAVVIMLYPLCKWFSDYRATHKQWWLSYF
jgi:uncharacterized membrane protein